MAGIDESRSFVALRIAVLTVSDSRTAETDRSGDVLASKVQEAGHTLAGRAIVRDDERAIRAQIEQWIGGDHVDAIVTTGGTGLTGRDVTPEALRPLFTKEITGFAHAFHQVSLGTIGLSTLQSRACAGLVGHVPVFALPGSPGAVTDGWDQVIRYQLDSRYRPCNLVEIMPRFLER